MGSLPPSGGNAPLGTIVVVGGSLAGLRAVETLRRLGFEGRIHLVGAERHLPYDRPPLSKQVLAGTWEPDRVWLKEEHALAGLEVETHLGRTATDLDLDERVVLLHGGTRLGFDGLLVATGATPRHLPDTADLDGVHVLRTLEDCLSLRRAFDDGPRVAVVGAGFIGSEVAATARMRGLEVTVLEALPVPLESGLGPVMGRVCGELHRDHGVDLRCDAGVAGFDGNGRVERVWLADGSTVDADVVVVGVGVTPNTSWLDSSGLTINNGLVCDERCATGAPGVYAAGDVARWHNPLFDEEMRVEHWTNASDQGVVAAQNLLAGPGSGEPYAPVPYFWSDQYDTKIQLVGHPRPGDEVRVVRGSVEDRRFVALYGHRGRLRAALAFSSPRPLMAYRRLISERASWDDALAHAASAG
ncbi:MAG: FAD-dependent oxidoreductase [Actinobacteria bacterium]|nr:MAG: FAD-dependent oxidoreductase [Actinomycetota bacterium]